MALNYARLSRELEKRIKEDRALNRIKEKAAFTLGEVLVAVLILLLVTSIVAAGIPAASFQQIPEPFASGRTVIDPFRAAAHHCVPDQIKQSCFALSTQNSRDI